MKRRILLLNNCLAGGGAERVLQLVAAEAAATGAALTIWAPEGTPEELRQLYPAGTRWRRLPFWGEDAARLSPRWFWQRGCRLLFEKLLLRLRRWDCVLAMKEGPSMRLASRLRGGKKLAWVHTDYATLHWSRYSFHSDAEELRCMRAFDRVICVSETVRRGIVGTVGDPGNLCLRYNPIDAARIRTLAREPIAEEKPADGPLLVAVGRLDRGKRFALLLDVCRELRREHRFTLWLVGGGGEEAALREQIAREGLSSCVLLGPRENPYPYIARADWLLSASESESYGLTVQEALILGVPVLACACGGVAESLDPRFGILTGLDRGALRDGLRRVLENPALRGDYAARIAAAYPAESLWEPRLKAIRALLEE